MRSSSGPWSCWRISVILARSSSAPPGARMILNGLASPCRSACGEGSAAGPSSQFIGHFEASVGWCRRLLPFIACLGHDCGYQGAAQPRVVVEPVGEIECLGVGSGVTRLGDERSFCQELGFSTLLRGTSGLLVDQVAAARAGSPRFSWTRMRFQTSRGSGRRPSTEMDSVRYDSARRQDRVDTSVPAVDCASRAAIWARVR